MFIACGNNLTFVHNFVHATPLAASISSRRTEDSSQKKPLKAFSNSTQNSCIGGKLDDATFLLPSWPGAQLLFILLPSTLQAVFVGSSAVSSPLATSPCWVQWPPFARRRETLLDTEQALITARMFSRVKFAWEALPATLFTDWRGTGRRERRVAKAEIRRSSYHGGHLPLST